MPPKDSRNLIVGRKSCIEMLENAPDKVTELILDAKSKSPVLAKITALAKAHAIRVRKQSKSDLDKLSEQALHQGVILVLSETSYSLFDDLLEKVAQTGPNALVVVADHLQDPHNLGAVIRSAAAAGALGVVIPKDRACPLSPGVAKAAQGMQNKLMITRVTNLTEALKELKKAGLWALAAATRQASPPWELDLKIPLALVIGSEEKGVGTRLLKECDLLASLPLAKGVESLNASVAAGILLFEIVRQKNM